MSRPPERVLVRRRFSLPPIRAAGVLALAAATAVCAIGPAASAAQGPPGGRGGGGGHSGQSSGHAGGDAQLTGLGKSPESKPKPDKPHKPHKGPRRDPDGKPEKQPGKKPPKHQHDDDHAHGLDDEGRGDSKGSGQGKGRELEKLAPTPAPLTPYEMPFPCGETWTGSTRAGHSPSQRSIDFNYPGGDLGRPVLAAASGTVTTAVVGKNKPSYGQYVVIDHGNGESTLYGHLDSVMVAVGQVLTVGQQLGTVGTTGNSSGPHLHFEERLNGSDVDVWFHGALFPINTAATSQNCGGAPVTPQPPVMVPVPTDTVPLAGNLYGKAPAEVAIFKKASPASFLVSRTTKTKTIRFGSTKDQPFLGDWDGDGRVNPGVRNPDTRVFYLRVRGKDTTIRFGKKTDVPVAGNWDGVGTWEIGVWRAKSATFILRAADGKKSKVRLGDADDLPVTGDWDGNGTTDLGVYDRATATFTLRGAPDPATGVAPLTQVPYGAVGDLPVAGDWDGNGTTDLGTWSPTTAAFSRR